MPGVLSLQRCTDHRCARAVEEVGESGIALRPHRDAEFGRLDRGLTQEHHKLQERLEGARSDLRFAGKRIAAAAFRASYCVSGC
ncbi:hypothetical protein GCM10009647_092500 [Streptomyces sanglieri]